MSENNLFLRPVFVTIVAILNPILFFIALWVGITMSAVTVNNFSLGFVAALLVILIGSVYLRYVYGHMSYEVSDKEITYSADYIVLQKSVNVKTSEIREVSHSQNIVQRIFGLGNVILRTRITNQGDVVIRDVEYYKEVADEVAKIVFAKEK